jgi:hypothetical protein
MEVYLTEIASFEQAISVEGEEVFRILPRRNPTELGGSRKAWPCML